ncbi:MAG: class I SAM-dependent methyltransferase [Thermoplasmata archaeon]
MSRASSAVDWKGWLRRWDEQQESFNPDRERRFSTMFDVLEASVGRRFTALDLGSGPGSLSARLLRRFPRGRSVAVDYDPVSLRVGQGALGSSGGRLQWVDARLGHPGWTERLPRRRYDAALSTTALHWLTAPALGRLYRDLHGLLRPGGVLLNGDHLPWESRQRRLSRLAGSVRHVRFRGASLNSEWAGWKKWWEDAERVPELRPLFREREIRQSQHPKHGDLTLDFHCRTLRRAGFREVAVVWQDVENRVLFAIR